MSRLQPTLIEAIEQVRLIERAVANSAEAIPIKCGFYIRYKRMRSGWDMLWPISDITRRCDDCSCVLRASRDAGGQGFYYDSRWLTADPAARDPRLSQGYTPHFVCLSCLNRVRPALRKAQEINEIRLTINRIKREVRHAA